MFNIFNLLNFFNFSNLKFVPLLIIVGVFYFLYKTLEFVFKVIFYIVIAGLIFYLFKDVIMQYIPAVFSML